MVIDDGLNAYVYEETSTIATECPAAEVGATKRPRREVPRSFAMAPAIARDLSGRPTVDRVGRTAVGLVDALTPCHPDVATYPVGCGEDVGRRQVGRRTASLRGWAPTVRS